MSYYLFFSRVSLSFLPENLSLLRKRFYFLSHQTNLLPHFFNRVFHLVLLSLFGLLFFYFSFRFSVKSSVVGCCPPDLFCLLCLSFFLISSFWGLLTVVTLRTKRSDLSGLSWVVLLTSFRGYF